VFFVSFVEENKNVPFCSFQSKKKYALDRKRLVNCALRPLRGSCVLCGKFFNRKDAKKRKVRKDKMAGL